MITLKSGPNCGSSNISPYQEVVGTPEVDFEIMPGVKVNAGIITRYFVCQNCKLIFQNPRMSDRELDKYYAQGYYRRQLNLTEEQMDADEAYRAKIDAEIIKRYIPKAKSHLGIGGSRGFLLDLIGADVKVLVEPNVNYPRAKGVEVYPEINKVPQKSFDLVTAIHVLEHVSKPLDYLKSMAKLIGKTGYLVIEVPTWKSPGGPLRFVHLYHFEPDVLKLMCKRAGLSVIHTEFTPHLVLICEADHS